MRLLHKLKALLRTWRHPITGPWGYGLLPGTRRDYVREAGNPWENSVVSACLRAICTAFNEAPLVVRCADGTLDPDHPAARLMARPNPGYDGAMLTTGCLVSLYLHGNAYIVPVRSALGRPVELWFVPHWSMKPVWGRDDGAFIDGYEYRIDGRTQVLPADSVVHLRFPIMDPANPRRGYGPLRSVLREVFTDNEAASLSAALMRMPILGAVIGPESGEEMSTEQCRQLRELWLDRFGADNRGSVLVSSKALSVQAPPQLTPDKLLLDRVRRVPEERICAAMGVPPIVAGMGAGLERATYANFRISREAFYESTIVPMQVAIAGQLSAQLLPMLGSDPREAFAYDLRNVRVLQEDEDARWRRLTAAVRAGVIDADEARHALGFPRRGAA